MNLIEEKFSRLANNNAPGQESRQTELDWNKFLKGEKLIGVPVDFSHGDVNQSAFAPTPGALEEFVSGFARGSEQAYTEYRGAASLRTQVADHLSTFTGTYLSGEEELIVTPGTQSALFLAIASTVIAEDKVAIVKPDYFANRKLVEFIGAKVLAVGMEYLGSSEGSGIDLNGLEAAFKSGAKIFLFSNPNNPTGVVYSTTEIDRISALANQYGATVIVDQLYSRLLYSGVNFTHLCANQSNAKNVITIMGPSKTESLSGFRLGVAFGPRHLIDRMEKLQAIVSLRAPGYCQAVLRTWFTEPSGWLADRITKHQSLRDDLVKILRTVSGLDVRASDAGSYLFPCLPALSVNLIDFVRILRHQAAVTVTPGTEFSPDDTNSVRVNFSQNHVAAVQAISRTVELINRYRL